MLPGFMSLLKQRVIAFIIYQIFMPKILPYFDVHFFLENVYRILMHLNLIHQYYFNYYISVTNLKLIQT